MVKVVIFSHVLPMATIMNLFLANSVANHLLEILSVALLPHVYSVTLYNTPQNLIHDRLR